MMENTDEELREYGYAPGNYVMKCHGCSGVVWNVDKRAMRCRQCAIEAAKSRDLGKGI